MATATKTKRSKKPQPKRESLGNGFARAQAQQIQQLKRKWLRHQIQEKLNAEDALITPAAKDLGIELTGEFYSAPLLELMSKSQLAQLATMSGVEVPNARGTTKETVIASLLKDRGKLVIPQEIESL